MAMPEHRQPDLVQLQRWLLAAITHPAGVRAGMLSEDAQQQIALPPEEMGRVVLRSERMSAEERLAVYQQAYFGRLIEALREFFPCLAENLGEEVFTQFAVNYLQRYPSRSYTLHRLADRFVPFLEETRPSDASTAHSWTGFWIDLARLELAIDRVFDAPGPEREPKLGYQQLAAIDAEHWPGARLRLARGMELLRFEFPVGEYYSTWKRGERLGVPLPRPSFAALLRRDYVVRRYELTAVQFELLRSISEGNAVGDAIGAGAEIELDLDALAVHLQDWFRRWAADGFFRAVEV